MFIPVDYEIDYPKFISMAKEARKEKRYDNASWLYSLAADHAPNIFTEVHLRCVSFFCDVAEKIKQ
jgi:hypothetical protein